MFRIGIVRSTSAWVIVGCCWCVPGAVPAVAQPVDIETGLPPQTRVPQPWGLPLPPSVEDQAEAEQTIRRLLEGRIDLAFGRPKEMGKELFNLARRTTDDPAARYVLNKMAWDLALKAHDGELAHAVIEDLRRHHRIDALKMRHDFLMHALMHDRDREVVSPAVRFEQAMNLIEESLMADRIDLAVFLYEGAANLLHESDDRTLIDLASQWDRLLHEWMPHLEEAQRAALRLAQEPRDQESQLALGRYLCFIKGDWARGLQRLAQGSDKALRALAESDLRTQNDPRARMEIAEQWRELAGLHKGLPHRRLVMRAEEIDRRIYPALGGLARLSLESRMLSRPLFVFDSHDPPGSDWVADHLHFHANHGREGSGSWANMSMRNGQAILMANRAGYVQTIEKFPPEGIEHWQIEAILRSTLAMGTAFEFAGQRMYFGGEGGIHVEGGWVPNVIYPIKPNRDYHFIIDLEPNGISFTLNGVHLGTMPTDRPARGPIVLRGWEGHVHCKRLVAWTVPNRDLVAPPDRVDHAQRTSISSDLGEVNYPGFWDDLRTMRETVLIPAEEPVNASTGEALAAASRVFECFPEVGMPRWQVLQYLGDPATISDYGVAAEDGPDAPLTYCFDTGFGGFRVTIHFEGGKVSSIDRPRFE